MDVDIYGDDDTDIIPVQSTAPILSATITAPALNVDDDPNATKGLFIENLNWVFPLDLVDN
jgi:hypothetical protein